MPEESLSNQLQKQPRKGSIHYIKRSYYLHQRRTITAEYKIIEVQTIRTKTIKLDSLILEEHDNIKECLMELDLLKQKLITNSIEEPQEEQNEDVTICRECDIRRIDPSKTTEKRYNPRS